MPQDIFISYSRRDQEFVTRLASDLNAQVSGVWFDQSTIQLGQKWHDEIMEGIRGCKAFILVLSLDAMESRYVREELNKALELGKTIFPVIYRPAKWTGEFEALVKDVQTLDLRSGSYTDNFQKLVDGLLEVGAGRAAGNRPFLRQPTKTSLSIVFSKIPGWAFAWSLGWLVFWTIASIILGIIIANQGNLNSNHFLSFILILTSGAIGGFTGGLVAGLFTMLALRPNAPSIAWKHMAPTIRIWGISGPLGMIVSGSIVYAIALGIQFAEPNCDNLGIGECFAGILVMAFVTALVAGTILAVVFLFIVSVAWFLLGLFAGWLVVRHIRRLEPGITRSQGVRVSAGWGCGAIVAAFVMALLAGLFSNVLGL